MQSFDVDAGGKSSGAALPEPPVPVALLAVSGRLSRAVVRRVEGAGSSGTWRTLAALVDHGPMRISELADWERISQPTMTTRLSRMELERLVQRLPDPDDGRAVLISITDAGIARYVKFREHAAAVLAPPWVRFSAAEQAALARVVPLIARLIEEPELR